MKNFCKKCMSEFEGKAQVKTGFCPGCVDAIKRGKTQTKAIKSGKLKIAKTSVKKVKKEK